MNEGNNLADPFADLKNDLEDLKGSHAGNEGASSPPKSVNLEQINKVAEEENFTKRQPKKAKPKVERTSVSFYPDEYNLLDHIEKEYSRVFPERNLKVSVSDILRAALYNFETVDNKKRALLIKENRAMSNR